MLGKDARGWPIHAGSFVRVDPTGPGLSRWWGFARSAEETPSGRVLRVEEKNRGRLRPAHAAHCTVVPPPEVRERARRRQQVEEAWWEAEEDGSGS
jgi:hypothetical protein